VFFLGIAIAFLVLVLELVRRRRLRVEYSWLWILAGVGLVFLILRYEVLVWLTELAGAVMPTSTVFFLACLFLGLLSVHYSVRLSDLTRDVKELAQELALLRERYESTGPADLEVKRAPSGPSARESGD
jgi:hypothetical protein